MTKEEQAEGELRRTFSQSELLQQELTCARLAVNDFYNCRTQDELAKWRAAQQRLIEAAKAVGRLEATR